MNPWTDEAWRFAVTVTVTSVVGALLGSAGWGFAIGVLGYLGWHLSNLFRLFHWLRDGKRFHPPESSGVWGEVFQRIYRLQQRNRKRKRKLGKMLNRFQEATSAMPDATVVLNADEEIEWWNDAAGGLFGFQFPRDVGQRIGNLLRHPDFVRYLRAGDYEAPVIIPSPRDEHKVISVRIVPYGKNQRLVVARDMTRIQKLEQMRRDFVANVSHELRTPLTVVSGYLEALEEDAERLDPQWRHTLGVMRQQTERMERIVEDLLMLSRLETEQQEAGQEPVSVPSELAAICEDARRLSGEDNHDIRLEAEPRLWLRGNDAELRSLFSNLVFNAVRYTPAGGRIEVCWFCRDGQPCFEVRDTGIGIAAQHIPRLTERFYRIDVGRSRSSGGTGLGLAIVKHVLLRHGGRLEIESRVGEGSTFRACFPAGRLLEVSDTSASAPEPPEQARL